MIEDSSKLQKGQILKVDLNKVKDRLPEKLNKYLMSYPYGKLVGYKMVDGNQFGLVLELKEGLNQWFFEKELSIVENDTIIY